MIRSMQHRFPCCAAFRSLAAGVALALAAPTAFPASADSLPFRLEPILGGLDRITGLLRADAADPAIYLVEQRGSVRRWLDSTLQPDLFLDLQDRVLSSAFEQGLTGLAFAPAFPSDPRIYVHYTRADGASVISRFHVPAAEPLQADATSEEVLLVVAQPHPTHNCNQLAFGPDGMLYIGCGDGGAGSGPLLDPQFMGHALGKLLRIDVSAASGYLVPADNPFVHEPGALPEIWANGLRNPFRFSFDEASGDLWLTDVGQANWEEVNHVPAGAAGLNFGWPVLEGDSCWPPQSTCDASDFRPPTHVYAHEQGRCAVIGGQRLRDALPAMLEAVYLFADFCSGEVFGLRQVGSGEFLQEALAAAPGYALTSFGRAQDGTVLLGTYGAGYASVLRMQYQDAIFGDGIEAAAPLAAAASVPRP